MRRASFSGSLSRTFMRLSASGTLPRLIIDSSARSDPMKICAALVMLLFLCSGIASAQWKKDNALMPDTPDRKAGGNLGGTLLAVEDPGAFVEEWQKPETPKIN